MAQFLLGSLFQIQSGLVKNLCLGTSPLLMLMFPILYKVVMKISKYFALVLSLFLFNQYAIAQPRPATLGQPVTDSTLTPQEQKQRLEDELFIRRLVNQEVDQEVEQALNVNTALINILLAVLTLIPILATIYAWVIRHGVISELANETLKRIKSEVEKQLEKAVTIELEKQTPGIRKEVEKQLEKEVAEELQKQTAATRKEIERLTFELCELYKLQKEVSEELQRQTAASKQEIEKVTSEFVSEILHLQTKKDNLIEQLNEIIPTSRQVAVVSEESVAPEIQQEIEELTSQLEVLQEDNPELAFTTNDYLKQGDALFLARRYEEAIEYYDHAIQGQDDSYIAWVNRGRALRRLERYEEALTSYDRGIEFKVDYHIAWYGRGNSLKNLHRYNEAIYSYEKCLEIQSDFDLAWYNKARCHSLQGNKDEAIESLTEALNLNLERYRDIVEKEVDFQNLKEDERYKKLMYSYNIVYDTQL